MLQRELDKEKKKNMDTVKRVKTLYRTVPMGIKISTVKGANYTSFVTCPNIVCHTTSMDLSTLYVGYYDQNDKTFFFNHKEEQL